ncbi:MAG: extracellular solute-binding protein [Lachnospiraceae bacterium]|nr:extracellular solute-binding protein [Lachnospiraceae bacterium]
MANRKRGMAVLLAVVAVMSLLLNGCGSQKNRDGKVVIEMVQYKPEAVAVFQEFEEKFNATHDNIELVIDSPNDAMVILKTRFIREDNPDIIGIGGDINYSNFLDAQMLMDISDFSGLADIKENYLLTNKDLEYVPKDGVYAVPYMANAAGVLYNRDMFEEHGWSIPTTWDEFTQLCEEIQAEGIQPLYFGYKDIWTCLAPWNAIAVNLCPTDLAYQVNSGTATFTEAYEQVAVKQKALLDYAQPNPVAYSYNDACTAFARGQAAMYVIGSYAIPQIKSVNPDMNIDSFVFPANDSADKNVLNSGNDLMFCVMEDCEYKEEAYEVLRFLLEDENVQAYLNAQSAVPCKKGDYEMAGELDGMKTYIESGFVADFQDHHYPSEMAVDAMIQTYLLDNSSNALDTFLDRFDREWVRYNKDIIAKVKAYQEKGE